MSSGKWQPFCLDPNVLTNWVNNVSVSDILSNMPLFCIIPTWSSVWKLTVSEIILCSGQFLYSALAVKYASISITRVTGITDPVHCFVRLQTADSHQEIPG